MSDNTADAENSKSNPRNPVLLVIMDGVGLRDEITGNAVAQAHTETLTDLLANYPNVELKASGPAVGIPEGDMGNSEVGHNAIGSGQIIPQGPLRVQQMFDDGTIFQTQAWRDLIDNVKAHNSTLHTIGIFSDGNVHSNINHLLAIMKQAQAEGITRIRVHPAFDGRDTPPESADKYVRIFEDFVHELGDPDYKIADGGGRMIIWADRYENDWGMLKRGWEIAVEGKGRQFPDPTTAITTIRQEENPSSDQYLSPFVITDEQSQPIGTIKPHDSVVYLNFRADRAIESAVTFTYDDFNHFARQYANGATFRPEDIYFAGMSEYNADTHVPAHILVAPTEIEQTLSDTLSQHNISQYAISETVKYGHITYYFDGNHYLAPDDTLHTYVEIASDTDTSHINNRPWMKAAEITDALVDAMKSQKYDFLRVNYPNGDMVGHFGELEPGIVAVEAVDLQLKRLLEAADETGTTVIITADHGNVEELTTDDGEAVTSHSTNPVPCIFYNKPNNIDKIYQLSQDPNLGLSNLASTIALLLGVTPNPRWNHPILTPKK